MYIVIWVAFTRRSLNQLFCETKAHHWCIVCSFLPKQIQQIPTNVSVKLFWFPSQKIPIQKHMQPSQQPRTNCQLPTCFKVHAAWYRVVNLKEIWSFSCWAPPTDLVFQRLPLRILQGLTAETAHLKSIKSGTFIWITMSPLDAISSRKIWVDGKMPLQYIPRTSLFEKNSVLGCFARFLDTIWWLDDMVFGKTNIDTTPQFHHLLLVSRIIHINPFLVSALVGAENQVQHGTIKTIVGLRLHSDDGWDFWRGDCHQRKKLT